MWALSTKWAERVGAEREGGCWGVLKPTCGSSSESLPSSSSSPALRSTMGATCLALGLGERVGVGAGVGVQVGVGLGLELHLGQELHAFWCQVTTLSALAIAREDAMPMRTEMSTRADGNSIPTMGALHPVVMLGQDVLDVLGSPWVTGYPRPAGVLAGLLGGQLGKGRVIVVLHEHTALDALADGGHDLVEAEVEGTAALARLQGIEALVDVAHSLLGGVGALLDGDGQCGVSLGC